MVELAYDEKSCGGGLDFWGMFSDPVGSMIRMVAKIVMSGALGLFQAAFLKVGSDDVAASNVIAGETRWVVIYLSVGSLLFAAVKMALDRRGDAGQLAMKGLVRVAVISAVATGTVHGFALLMENYSNYLLQKSLKEVLSGIDCSDAVPAMVMLIVGCLLIIAAIIQMILLWVRLGVMVLLMGTLPMAAAASMTEWGGTWWRKHLAWMVAWLLYKPAVGLVMYTGATMISKSGADQINTQIAGMAMLLLSAIALPALLRLVVPATAALGGGSAGDATMGVVGGIASGAKSIGQAVGESGGSTGPKGPSGSDSSSGASGGQSGGGGGSSGNGSSGNGSSGGGSSGGGGGGGGGGGQQAAKTGGSAGAAGAGVLVVAALAAEAAKGVADVARSGVDDANRDDDHPHPSGRS